MKKIISLFLLFFAITFIYAEDRDPRFGYDNDNTNYLKNTDYKGIYIIKPHYSNKYVIENDDTYKALIYNKKTKELVVSFDNVVSDWQGMTGWNDRVVASDYTFVTDDYKQYVVKARTYYVEYKFDERFSVGNSPNPLVKTGITDIFVIKPYLSMKKTVESGKQYKVIIYKKNSDDIVIEFDNVVSAWQGMTGWNGAIKADDFTFVTADYKQYIVKLSLYDVDVED